jgi:hypothetical protein
MKYLVGKKIVDFVEDDSPVKASNSSNSFDLEQKIAGWEFKGSDISAGSTKGEAIHNATQAGYLVTVDGKEFH